MAERGTLVMALLPPPKRSQKMYHGREVDLPSLERNLKNEVRCLLVRGWVEVVLRDFWY